MGHESFEKLNDYTLCIKSRENSNYPRIEITRVFNFQARKIIEFHHHVPYNGKPKTFQETSYFHELPSMDEVKTMHQKLKEKGGKPPTWEEIIGDMPKPKHFGQTPGLGRANKP